MKFWRTGIGQCLYRWMLKHWGKHVDWEAVARRWAERDGPMSEEDALGLGFAAMLGAKQRGKDPEKFLREILGEDEAPEMVRPKDDGYVGASAGEA